MPSIPEPISSLRNSRQPQEAFDPIEFLVKRKFPFSEIPQRNGENKFIGLQTALAASPARISDEAMYRIELRKMPQRELKALVEAEKLAQKAVMGRPFPSVHVLLRKEISYASI